MTIQLDEMKDIDVIVEIVLKAYPAVQAIYLFGSYGTEYYSPESDIDIALLFDHVEAKKIDSLGLAKARFQLEKLTEKDVDLINIREVNTVLQKEIVMSGERVWCSNIFAADEFEMLIISKYQKLNEERAGIVQEISESGSVFRP